MNEWVYHPSIILKNDQSAPMTHLLCYRYHPYEYEYLTQRYTLQTRCIHNRLYYMRTFKNEQLFSYWTAHLCVRSSDESWCRKRSVVACRYGIISIFASPFTNHVACKLTHSLFMELLSSIKWKDLLPSSSVAGATCTVTSVWSVRGHEKKAKSEKRDEEADRRTDGFS